MKRQEWNEEQLEQLLKQLPSVIDKQSSEDIYQSVLYKQQSRKKPGTWIAPAIAAACALIIFALISPFFLQDFLSNEESAMELSSKSTAEDSANTQTFSETENQMTEAKISQERNLELKEPETAPLAEKQVTFVTNANEAGNIITVGFTDSEAKNILPISLEVDEKQEKLEQIEEINPEVYKEELGPITYALSETEFRETENPGEITIDYQGVPNLTSSSNDILYQNAIIETFRWLDYKKANLYTNQKEGIEFGQTGPKINLEVKKETEKAYFLYQFNEQTLKLLVPSPQAYDSIELAIDAMRQGIEKYDLKPTIMNNITTIKSKGKGNQLVIEFDQNVKFENTEPTIIMLEAILLTAKEFGYKTVRFNGITIDKIGVMDVTKPIEVPFSPNPIKVN